MHDPTTPTPPADAPPAWVIAMWEDDARADAIYAEDPAGPEYDAPGYPW